MDDMDEMAKIVVSLPLSLLADLRVRADLAGVSVTDWIGQAVAMRRKTDDLRFPRGEG